MVFLGGFLKKFFFHVGMRQFVTFYWRFYGKQKVRIGKAPKFFARKWMLDFIRNLFL